MRQRERSVNCPSKTPTSAAVTAPITTDATTAPFPDPTNQGISGSIAPSANEKNDEIDDCKGEPITRVKAELLACVGLQCELGILHHLIGQLLGEGPVDAASFIDRHELVALVLGPVVQRGPLHLELALHQLALGPHGDELAGRHRERAGDEAGHAGQSDEGAAGVRTRHAQDQRDVGDQPVAQAEDGGPVPPARDVAVVMAEVRLGRLRLVVSHQPPPPNAQAT